MLWLERLSHLRAKWTLGELIRLSACNSSLEILERFVRDDCRSSWRTGDLAQSSPVQDLFPDRLNQVPIKLSLMCRLLLEMIFGQGET